MMQLTEIGKKLEGLRRREKGRDKGEEEGLRNNIIFISCILVLYNLQPYIAVYNDELNTKLPLAKR